MLRIRQHSLIELFNLAADDGTADNKEADNLYRIKIDKNKTNARVVLERTFSDFKDYGEIEGVAVNLKPTGH